MQIKKVYVYDETAQKRVESTLVTDIISSEGASTAGNFVGATSLKDGKQGFVPKPLKGDQTKFLKGDGTWASNVPDSDTFLTKTEAERIYLAKVDTTDTSVGYADAADAANIADKLANAVNIQISDHDQSHTGTAVPFDGASNIILPMPQTFKGNVEGNATSANTAAVCTGAATTANQLAKPVRITIKDANGNIAGTSIDFTGADTDVTLFMPDLSTESARDIFGSNVSPDINATIAIQNPDGTGTTTANFGINGTTTIKLPATITSAVNTPGGVESAKKLANKIAVSISDSDKSHTGVTVDFDGSGKTISFLLPAVIKAALEGNATTATNAVNDANGNRITSTYAPLINPKLSGEATCTTPNKGDKTAKIATTEFVHTAIADAIGIEFFNQNSDTLTIAAMSAAINNDAHFATTLTKTYQPLNAALTSISGLSTGADRMIYTTGANRYAVTTLTKVARDALEQSSAAGFRSKIDALGKSENAVSATKFLSPVKLKLKQAYNSANNIGAEVNLQGNAETVTIPFPTTINATTAEKFYTARVLKIQDAYYENTGANTSFDGSQGVTLYLPAKIKAELDGNAKTSANFQTSRKVDGITFNAGADVLHYGTCSTAAGTVAKTVACSNFTLVDGSIINVWFTNANTATNPTLNVNSTGAKAMYGTKGERLTGNILLAGMYQFVYYGGNYFLTRVQTSLNADKLTTKRKITLTGTIIGNVDFDGTSDVTIATAENLHTVSSATDSFDLGGIIQTPGPDFVRVRAGSTANDAGYLEIATADNGTEPIYVRQYTRSTTNVTTPAQGFGTITRTATILGSDGSTSFPVKVNTPKLIATDVTITSASISTIGSNSTVTGQAYFYNNSTPALNTTSGAVIIGQQNKTNHIAIGQNWVQARTSVGGAASLNLNRSGGEIYIGDGSSSGYIYVGSEVGINTNNTKNVSIHNRTNQGDFYVNSKVIYLGDSTATVDSNLYVNLPANFSNTARFSKPVTVTGAATFNGATTLNSTVTVAGTTTVSGKISFTNTTQGNFSVSAGPYINGIRFNGSTNMYCYGYCSTAGNTAGKVVSVTGAGGGFTLTTGSRVTVKFASTNTAANPTLNVNSTGAKNMQYRGSNIPAAAIQANSIYDFVYTGSVWEVIGTMAWAVS